MRRYALRIETESRALELVKIKSCRSPALTLYFHALSQASNVPFYRKCSLKNLNEPAPRSILCRFCEAECRYISLFPSSMQHMRAERTALDLPLKPSPVLPRLVQAECSYTVEIPSRPTTLVIASGVDSASLYACRFGFELPIRASGGDLNLPTIASTPRIIANEEMKRASFGSGNPLQQRLVKILTTQQIIAIAANPNPLS